MKKIYSFMLVMLALMCSMSAKADITITKEGGWFESAYIEWTGATQNYAVQIKGGQYADFTAIDKELVRKYKDYYRADMVGLKAGTYQFKITGANDNSVATSGNLTVVAHDRSGFAHVGYSGGIGAYKNDGTLKDNARVIYVTAANAKTVKCNVMTDADTEYTGLQAILAAYEKGKETRPLAIRIIGTVKKADMDSFGSSAEGIQVKGKSGSIDMNITIEGIGNDATTHGFGFLVRSACSVEFRNFANMICMDDCLSLDTDNHHVWIHNMDFFYGGTGGDSDQAKGDGTVDIKGKSSHVTVSYNHFFDSGKCSLGGMKSETTACWMTYHHNWFDHSDSRHPRIRTAFYHCYNNYYDGNSKYGVGVTCGGSAFVEANYFRNVKYPMLISKQGTDAEGDGTFSGENGGVNKAYNNVIINPRKVQYYDGSQTDGKWDAVLVANRADAVTATAYTGGTSYNSEADQAARTLYIENKMDDPEDIPAIVRGELGAGRLEHGDFKWTFNNSIQDENYDVISELKSTLVNYESTVVSFADGSAISNRTPATATIDAGDGKGLDPEVNDAYVPSWAGGGGTIATGKQVIGENDDYFWFNADNQAQVNAYMSDNATEDDPSTIMTSGTFNATRTITNSKTGSCSDYTGSFLIPASGYFTMYYPGTMSSIAFYASGNGSQKWKIEKSVDGDTWTTVGTVEAKSSGAHPAVGATFGDGDGIKYVRVTNQASGGRDLQGVKVYTPVGAADLAVVSGKDNIALAIGGTYTITKGTDFTTTGTGAITYKSSEARVATVDEATGLVTAVSAGTAKITLTQAADDTHNSATLTYSVTVSDSRAPSSLALTSDAEVSLKKGLTSNIFVTGGKGALTYVSDASSIATVSDAGVITAVGYGTTTITVSDEGDAGTKPGKVTVAVTVADTRSASNLAVENEEIAVNRKESVKINVTANDGSVTFSSSDESIATVDAEGNVTGVLAGETSIIVSDAGTDDYLPGQVVVDVTVNDARTPSALQITSDNPLTIDMAVSRTSAITTSGAAGALTYDSDDDEIATVSADGVITGKKAGTTTITVSDEGNDDFKPGSQTITVTVLPIPTLEPVTWVTGDASTLKPGTSIGTSGATGVFISTDESGLELSYTSSKDCKIDTQKGVSYIKMGGSTQYAKDASNVNVLSTRYFTLPALTGSGTLSVSYAATAANINVVESNVKDATALATISKTANSVQLTDVDGKTLYLVVPKDKAYITGITWIPDAPDTRTASEIALTSSDNVAIDVAGTSQITYEKAAGTVTFESDSPEVATVSADGLITGVADGTATITVKDSGNSEYKAATLTIAVTVGTGVKPGTAAKTWDFTVTSSTDLANLEADCEEVAEEGATTNKNWYKFIISDEITRYGNGKQLAAKDTYVTLQANGQNLESTNGLLIARAGNVLAAKNVRIDANTRLSLNGGNIEIKIPSLKKDDKVYVDYQSAKNTESRSLTLTNGTGANLSTSARAIAEITVSADGDLVIKQTGGMYYYTIYVNPAETPEIPTGITNIEAQGNNINNGVIYDLQGRVVKTVKAGGVYIQNGNKVVK